MGFRASIPRLPFLMGVSTCMSQGSALTYPGSFSLISRIILLSIRSTLSLSRKKKSLLLLSSVRCFPSFILWAFITISLSSACLNIFLRATTAKHPEEITSLSTAPGPTLGSWFVSPTIIRRTPTGIAFNSALKRGRSTMDISSMITTSDSIGLSSLNSYLKPLSSVSDTLRCSILCIVEASAPVASVILLAARPVGAAREIDRPSVSKYLIIMFMIVVLPVPGPPVMTVIPFFIAVATASL